MLRCCFVLANTRIKELHYIFKFNSNIRYRDFNLHTHFFKEISKTILDYPKSNFDNCQLIDIYCILEGIEEN